MEILVKLNITLSLMKLSRTNFKMQSVKGLLSMQEFSNCCIGKYESYKNNESYETEKSLLGNDFKSYQTGILLGYTKALYVSLTFSVVWT